MKKSRLLTVLLATMLLAATALNLSGCLMSVSAEDLMNGISPNNPPMIEDMRDGNIALSDFGLRLLRACENSDKNTLISPLSVILALSMTANGADGQTKAQMEQVLGMSIEDLNSYLYSYSASLPQGEKYKLAIADSIWIKDDSRLKVFEAFLQSNANYYSADVYKVPFNKKTLFDINSWVKEKTDNMIPGVLNDIPDEALIYIINALAFEAEWSSLYKKAQVRDDIFTTEDGKEQQVELMFSTEHRYLEDSLAKGFIKYYKAGKYAFAALLPNEGVSMRDYIASLDGEKLASLLGNATGAEVICALPKFECEYSIEMSDILSGMGMSDAFSPKNADFSSLGSYDDGNIFISNIIHKTYIEVGERGTRAGAVTAIAMDGAAAGPEEEPKKVYLNRPFVYMLIDCENNVPFFIGTVMGID